MERLLLKGIVLKNYLGFNLFSRSQTSSLGGILNILWGNGRDGIIIDHPCNVFPDPFVFGDNRWTWYATIFQTDLKFRNVSFLLAVWVEKQKDSYKDDLYTSNIPFRYKFLCISLNIASESNFANPLFQISWLFLPTTILMFYLQMIKSRTGSFPGILTQFFGAIHIIRWITRT